MERFYPYLGVVAALFVGAFVFTFSSRTPVPVLGSELASTSMLAILDGPQPATVTIPEAATTSSETNPAAATTTETTQPSPAQKAPTSVKTPPKKPSIPATTSPAPATTPPASQTASAPVPQQEAPALPSSGSADLDAAAAALRGALVNVVCQAPAGSGLYSMTASGVVVSDSGYVLTNAHVAERFLLTDKGVTCALRVGSPAVEAYSAALVFISPSWVSTNAVNIRQSQAPAAPDGDYALLVITGRSGPATSASVTPLPLAATDAKKGAGVAIGSYAAQFLDSSQLAHNLYPTFVFDTVRDIFTLSTDTIDILDLGGTVAAQEGSSGGGVCDAAGHLTGLITSSTVSGDTSSRTLYALSISYVERMFASESGTALSAILAENPTFALAQFAANRDAASSTLHAALAQ